MFHRTYLLATNRARQTLNVKKQNKKKENRETSELLVYPVSVACTGSQIRNINCFRYLSTI